MDWLELVVVVVTAIAGYFGGRGDQRRRDRKNGR